MDGGQTDAACTKFEASQRISAGAGTLLALAVCNEQRGKIASAHQQFVEAATLSARAGRKDREKVARDAISRLSSRVPRLVVRVGATMASQRVKLDGRELDQGVFGVAFPIDPGLHSIESSAAGYRSWSQEATVAEGATVTVDVPRLEPLVEHEPAAKHDTHPGTAAVVTTTPPAPAASPVRTIGWISIAAGGAAAATGLFFGARASSAWSDFRGRCDPAACADASARPLYDDARQASTLATILVGAGAAAALAGAAMVLFAPSPKSTATARVSVTAHWGGVYGHVLW